MIDLKELNIINIIINSNNNPIIKQAFYTIHLDDGCPQNDHQLDPSQDQHLGLMLFFSISETPLSFIHFLPLEFSLL